MIEVIAEFNLSRYNYSPARIIIENNFYYFTFLDEGKWLIDCSPSEAFQHSSLDVLIDKLKSFYPHIDFDKMIFKYKVKKELK